MLDLQASVEDGDDGAPSGAPLVCFLDTDPFQGRLVLPHGRVGPDPLGAGQTPCVVRVALGHAPA